MPDGVANTFEPDDFDWHDGILVDLQLAGFVGEPRELRMTIDLYPSDDPQAQSQTLSLRRPRPVAVSS